MIDNNYTHITMLLDRTGSMYNIKGDMEGACSTFLQKQAEEPGKCTVSIHQFNSHSGGLDYETICDFVDIKNAPTVVIDPRGWTPLYDAIGRTVISLGEKLRKLEESSRPGKVIVVIITDGQENASQEYRIEQIRQIVEHQKDVYSWNFVFLGANFDAVSVGQSFGLAADNSLQYAFGASGCGCMTQSLCNNVSSYRSGTKKSVTFEAVDYKNQADLGVTNE